MDYEVKCSNQQYLSFVIYKTETLASAYTEIYTYNLDLTTGTELTLPGLLGPDWKERCDQVIRDEMARCTAEEDAVYFTQDQGGFSGVTDDQAFYLDADGNPVLFFEKYEIAPGYPSPSPKRICSGPAQAGPEQTKKIQSFLKKPVDKWKVFVYTKSCPVSRGC